MGTLSAASLSASGLATPVTRPHPSTALDERAVRQSRQSLIMQPSSPHPRYTSSSWSLEQSKQIHAARLARPSSSRAALHDSSNWLSWWWYPKGHSASSTAEPPCHPPRRYRSDLRDSWARPPRPRTTAVTSRAPRASTPLGHLRERPDLGRSPIGQVGRKMWRTNEPAHLEPASFVQLGRLDESQDVPSEGGPWRH